MEVLILLAEKNGQLVTRAEIIQRLWGDNVFVDTRHGINTAIHKLRAALDDDPGDPRILQTVVGKGYKLISRVESVGDQPVEPAHAHEENNQPVPDVLLRVGTVQLRHYKSEDRSPSKYGLLPGFIVLLAMAGGLFVWRRHLSMPRGKTEAPSVVVPTINPRPAIAVIGFQNLSGQKSQSWIAGLLSEMISTDLAAGEELRLVSGEEVARARTDLSLPEVSTYAPDTLAHLRRVLAADYVLLGSYSNQPGRGQLRLDLRLQKTASGELVASITGISKENDLPDLAARMSTQIREHLGLAEATSLQQSLARSAMPSKPEAARYYSEGLERLRQFEPAAAKPLLERSVAVEPEFPLSHSALAAAWESLGYDEKSQAEAKRAFDLAASLPQRDRLVVEGQFYDSTRQWGRAVDTYPTLFQVFPDSVEYGLKLAAAQRAKDERPLALETVNTLLKLPPPLRDDPRIALEEAADAGDDGGLHHEVAMRALSLAQAHGQKEVEANALLALGDDARIAGRHEEARRDLHLAYELFGNSGDKFGMARALNEMGTELRYAGDTDGARSAYDQSLSICLSIGNDHGVASAYNNLATEMNLQGELRAASTFLANSLKYYTKIGDRLGAANVSNNLGTVLDDQGALESGLRSLRRALAIYQDIGDKHGMTMSSGNIAAILVEQGHLAEAKRILEDISPKERDIGDKDGTGYTLDTLGDIEMATGNLDSARRFHEQAIDVRKGLGEGESTAESQLRMAHLAIEQGQFQESEQLAREATLAFQTTDIPDSIPEAQATLAEALMGQGSREEAKQLASNALLNSVKLQRPAIRMQVKISAARVIAAADGYAPAAVSTADKDLRSVLAEASRLGYRGFQYDSRLALGEIAMKSKSVTIGHSLLESLKRDAHSYGFDLFQQRASALLYSGQR